MANSMKKHKDPVEETTVKTTVEDVKVEEKPVIEHKETFAEKKERLLNELDSVVKAQNASVMETPSEKTLAQLIAEQQQFRGPSLTDPIASRVRAEVIRMNRNRLGSQDNPIIIGGSK